MRRTLLLLVGSLWACSSPVSRAVAPPAPPASSDGFEPTPPELRLPGDVRPLRYALDLTLVPDQPTASGTLHVDARLTRPTQVVWMHGLDLTISRATVAGHVARVITAPHGLIGLVLQKELFPSEIAIDITYTTKLERAKSRGIYTEREGDQVFAYTVFEPLDARRAFPCFDEPGYKAPWQLTFHVRREHVALGNAPVIRETEERDGMKKVELAPTKPLPTYLVAFVVGPFEIVDAGIAGRAKTPLRFVIPPGRGGELGYAKRVTAPVVAALEDYFDMDYPFGKLDVAVVPRFWGTMEHPGLVAMGQPLTLIRPEQETRERRFNYANILAHELAHYWFGDVVTMLWWDDTWLNEGLGQWLDLKITHAVEPSWRSDEKRVYSSADAMAADETVAARAMRQPVTTEENIEASFDGALTYSKGAALFRMFEAHVGEAKWRDFMRAYIRAHAWGSATAEDLLGIARTQLGAEIELGLRSFLEHPGVPRLELACKNKELVATQRRSLPMGVTVEGTHAWRFPACVRYGDTKSAHTWCFEHAGPPVRTAVAACPTWLVPNAGAYGYYRTTVDPDVAKQLLTPGSAVAKVAKPTAVERMLIVIDLGAAVQRGEIDRTKLLAIAPLLAADPDDLVAQNAPWVAGMQAELLDDALYAKAQRYWLATFGPRARQLGWKRPIFERDERHELRRAFLHTIAALDPGLAKQARDLAERWLATQTGLEDDLVDGVLAAAAYSGDAAYFERLLAAVKQPRDRTELRRLFGVLGQFRDPALAARALELLVTPGFDMRDMIELPFGVLGRRETRALALAFLERNIDRMTTGLTDIDVAALFAGLMRTVCDRESRDRLRALFEPRAKRHPGAENMLTRALEQTERCIANFERERPALEAFLARY